MLLSILNDLRQGKIKSVWDTLKHVTDPIILYGTGDGAEKILNQFKEHSIVIDAIFASDEFVRGQIFQGYTVEKFEVIKKRYTKFVIVIAFGSHIKEVLADIRKLSENYELLVPDVPVIGETLFTTEFFLEHYQEFEKVWQLLYDDESKKVYENIIRYKITGQLSFLDESSSDLEDAYSNILNLHSNESFADLGAYRGDSIEKFLKVVSKYEEGVNYDSFYKSIVAMEPDAKNYSKLCNCVANLKLTKARCVQSAAGNYNGNIHFYTGGGRQSKVQTKKLEYIETKVEYKAGSWADSKANRAAKYREELEKKYWATIPVNTLDSLVDENGISFINMDVEGEERQAIEGCGHTIISYKPKLLIAVYHRTEDLYAIPLQIFRMQKDYKFYLRKHPCIPAWDINLYCI